ncbi:bifunctional 2-polyprenyl-6-hydroxyphenol methylase/3-demethylubiquinol 3-O-methyltransferase UbiG [Psychrobacter arenosus]|uniref:bifunctional 2-polyprenyl-6-hydroxyphenol methylase/3-demethylubiquinol 3-O-methyltransferase UbiG n=1 Tax=Psychrobacter arenosus TaxID=256326 RepID=UPI0019193C77|nr:bifunctional 2-polyprenyl-6-hydroxyphenol methylase/3-demethylubiquinol 3-O-methyltransferase UbiG [Psychrobacter arenosus]
MTSTTTPTQPSAAPTAGQNVDPNEVAKFTKLADEWWDKQGAFATLHEINPLRLNWITDAVNEIMATDLEGLRIVDVGCGGGILTESMARRGANAIGIDLGEENLKAAAVHAEQSGLTATLQYQHIAVESFAAAHKGQFDVVTCMEMLEHVPDPSAIVQACFDLLKPGGVCVLSTINRNPKSYLFAIVGAEYVLRLLDRGTHDYAKFITPAELDKMATNAGFTRDNMIGLHYNPLTKRYWLAQNVDVNYMMSVKKPH